MISVGIPALVFLNLVLVPITNSRLPWISISPVGFYRAYVPERGKSCLFVNQSTAGATRSLSRSFVSVGLTLMPRVDNKF